MLSDESLDIEDQNCSEESSNFSDNSFEFEDEEAELSQEKPLLFSEAATAYSDEALVDAEWLQEYRERKETADEQRQILEKRLHGITKVKEWYAFVHLKNSLNHCLLLLSNTFTNQFFYVLRSSFSSH